MTAIIKMYPTSESMQRPAWPHQSFRLNLNGNSARREVIPIGDGDNSNSEVKSTKQGERFGSDSGEPPIGSGYQRPGLPESNKAAGQKTLWACGVGALASTGLALVTHFSNKEIFGPANDILKPVFTFTAILLATIFGAGWLTEPNLQSIDSTSIAHSSGSIG